MGFESFMAPFLQPTHSHSPQMGLASLVSLHLVLFLADSVATRTVTDQRQIGLPISFPETKGEEGTAMMHAVVCGYYICKDSFGQKIVFYHQQLHLTFAEQPQDNSQSYSLAFSLKLYRET